MAGDCPLDTLPSPRWHWRMVPTTVGVETTPPHERLEPNLICGVCKISNGYNYILERNLQVARLLGASIELLGASLITGNSSSISSFSSNSELAILLEYHYPTILMTTLQPYSPYPRYGGSALTVVIVL